MRKKWSNWKQKKIWMISLSHSCGIRNIAWTCRTWITWMPVQWYKSMEKVRVAQRIVKCVIGFVILLKSNYRIYVQHSYVNRLASKTVKQPTGLLHRILPSINTLTQTHTHLCVAARRWVHGYHDSCYARTNAFQMLFIVYSYGLASTLIHYAFCFPFAAAVTVFFLIGGSVVFFFRRRHRQQIALHLSFRIFVFELFCCQFREETRKGKKT